MTKNKSNTLFYIGIVLLAIGAFGLTFAAFFAIIGLPIFILGIILVLLSRTTWKRRLVTIGVFIALVFVFWPVWLRINKIGPEVFLIPDDYRGRITIIFKKDCGINLEKTKEGLVYDIPNDGILLLSNEQKYGIIDHTYYLVDENGNRNELPKMDVRDFNEEWTLEKNPNEPPRDKLGVFHWGRTGSTGRVIGQNGEVLNEDEQYTFLEFYISTYEDLSKSFGFKYERKIDTIIKSKMKQCK